MQMNPGALWVPRLSAFAVAALLAASATYWILRWPQQADSAGLGRSQASDVRVLPATSSVALARLLGNERGGTVTPVVGEMAGRLVLSGIVASASGSGVALISVDGNPARSYAVGSRVAGGLELTAVTPRRAMLSVSAQAPASVTLELKRSAQ